MATPASVLQLVDTFSTHIDHYKSSRYNETQVRREFLDPFFKALGWDIDNESGYADAYKDVIHEDAIKIEGTTKAPDYCFRIGGTRKFFVEAKRPGVDVAGAAQPAYQARRYAWSAKLPLVILTDFEEFAVYDARIKPHATDRASKARVFFCTYLEYEEKWNEIADIFARESILRGAFDKYSESSSRKQGTAEVDVEFLGEIERWREILARDFAIKNDSLDNRELNFAVQKTIDRIVFLRICEDRGTEDYGRLKNLPKRNIYKALCELFKEADSRYNSGLFHFTSERHQHSLPDSLTPSLSLGDKSLGDILKNLYYPESPYEFSVLPADILGQVYERFLGKTISLTPSHHVKVDEKPEVRKAGGVYYTPTYVVDHIVGKTLGRLLNKVSRNSTKPIPVSQASKIRVMDPACGSGTFLIAAYQYLLDWHLDQYVKNANYHSRGAGPKIYQSKGGAYRLTTNERKRILLNNIYGVDIDPQAVEVTKLSLLLKVLEGETEQILQRDWIRERQRILPDLGENILCGNSLIGSEFYEDGQMLLLDDESKYRVNVFDWKNSYPEIMEDGGFSCVIANPPYGATLDQNQKDFFGSHYTCQSYQLDSYLLFLERTLKLLARDDGYIGFIIPNPWLTNLRQQATRRFVCKNAAIEEIVHFTYPVFRSAVVDTEIIVARNKSDLTNKIRVSLGTGMTVDGKLESNLLTTHVQKEWVDLDGDVINIFLTPPERSLYRRIKSETTRLEHWFKINVGIKPYQKGKGRPKQTANMVKERPFDSESPKDDTYVQLLRGKDIDQYVIEPVAERYISYGPWLAEPRPAANFDAEQKILMRQTGDSLIAALDQDQRVAMNNMHVLVRNELEDLHQTHFFLGIINSTFCNWYYQCLNPEAGEALAEVKKENVSSLPIYPVDFSSPKEVERHDEIVRLAGELERLVSRTRSDTDPATKAMLQTELAATRRRLDEIVFDHFRLTDDERDLIRNKRSIKG